MESMEHVYLCHKCGGLLTRHNADPALYGCGCMSGYIRDWQYPTPVTELRSIQLDACRETLALYQRQGRDPDGDLIRKTLARIKALESARSGSRNCTRGERASCVTGGSK
jgi:hypothetical protein